MDLIAKNRRNMGNGEANGMAKLKAAQVIKIRKIEGPVTRQQAGRIASLYGISETYVYHLRSENLKKWKHL